MKVVVTTGAVRRAKLQSYRHHHQTNTQFLQARCSSNAQPVAHHWCRLTCSDCSRKSCLSAWMCCLLMCTGLHFCCVLPESFGRVDNVSGDTRHASYLGGRCCSLCRSASGQCYWCQWSIGRSEFIQCGQRRQQVRLDWWKCHVTGRQNINQPPDQYVFQPSDQSRCSTGQPSDQSRRSVGQLSDQPQHSSICFAESFCNDWQLFCDSFRLGWSAVNYFTTAAAVEWHLPTVSEFEWICWTYLLADEQSAWFLISVSF